MFLRELYSVFLDDNFIGITEDECECIEIAVNANNKVDKSLYDDDLIDRIQWHKISVNRYFYDYHKYTNDKLSNDSILCYSNDSCEEAIKKLNKIQLETERAEAKLRALLM